jgi:hypothetical protein
MGPQLRVPIDDIHGNHICQSMKSFACGSSISNSRHPDGFSSDRKADSANGMLTISTQKFKSPHRSPLRGDRCQALVVGENNRDVCIAWYINVTEISYVQTLIQPAQIQKQLIIIQRTHTNQNICHVSCKRKIAFYRRSGSKFVILLGDKS